MEAYQNIDQYIDQFPDDLIQGILRKMRKVIAHAAPDAEEAIKYGIPTFRLNSKNLVHFGAFKNHVSFFPTGAGVAAFKEELGKNAVSKGTVQFPLDKPIPYKLIEKIVRYRMKQVLSKKKF
jgi:uncharacterized protein YdhG (YjbR/CyaY superfamily)